MVLPIPSPRTSAPSPLTWAGRGPRRGAGCRGQWPGPRQTGGRRAAERAVLPGCLHTGRAGLRHSPGTGEMGGVSGQCPWPGPSTWLCLTEKTPQPLSASFLSCHGKCSAHGRCCGHCRLSHLQVIAVMTSCPSLRTHHPTPSRRHSLALIECQASHPGHFSHCVRFFLFLGGGRASLASTHSTLSRG